MHGLWIVVGMVAVVAALVVLVYFRVRAHEQRREEDEACAGAVVVGWNGPGAAAPYSPEAVISNKGEQPVRDLEITRAVVHDHRGREWVGVLPGGPPYRRSLGAGEAWPCVLPGPYRRNGESHTVVGDDRFLVTFRFTDRHGHQWEREGDDPPRLMHTEWARPHWHAAPPMRPGGAA